LQRQIASLAPNTLLQTEEKLGRRFGVSRVTIRRALELLEGSGAVTRQRGRGTTVSGPKVTRNLLPLFTFEDDLRMQGIIFETRLVAEQAACSPPEAIRKRLRLPPLTTTPFIAFVRLVNDEIVCHDRRYFAPDLIPNLEGILPLERPISEVLTELVGSPITRVDWETEIVAVPEDIATVLRITPGVLTVINTFTEYLANGSPIQAGTMSYRVDRVKFRFAAEGAYETVPSIDNNARMSPVQMGDR
jgi:GntR family transcriptional regulator